MDFVPVKIQDFFLRWLGRFLHHEFTVLLIWDASKVLIELFYPIHYFIIIILWSCVPRLLICQMQALVPRNSQGIRSFVALNAYMPRAPEYWLSYFVPCGKAIPDLNFELICWFTRGLQGTLISARRRITRFSFEKYQWTAADWRKIIFSDEATNSIFNSEDMSYLWDLE